MKTLTKPTPPPSQKTVAAKPNVVKIAITPAVKKPVAKKKAAVKKPAAKKTVAVKKTPVKKPAAKKTVAVKKPAAKKTVAVKKPVPPVAKKPIVVKTTPAKKGETLRERIMNLMKDGESRTISEIHRIWGLEYSSTIGKGIAELAIAGKLERIVGPTNAAVYRLARNTPIVAPDPDAITNNPFIWRTYQRWVPENNSHAKSN